LRPVRPRPRRGKGADWVGHAPHPSAPPTREWPPRLTRGNGPGYEPRGVRRRRSAPTRTRGRGCERACAGAQACARALVRASGGARAGAEGGPPGARVVRTRARARACALCQPGECKSGPAGRGAFLQATAFHLSESTPPRFQGADFARKGVREGGGRRSGGGGART
jgi:hypothetical protein